MAAIPELKQKKIARQTLLAKAASDAEKAAVAKAASDKEYQFNKAAEYEAEYQSVSQTTTLDLPLPLTRISDFIF